jgi:prepilin-type N-terminal cleavage/methylation domain-containing protein
MTSSTVHPPLVDRPPFRAFTLVELLLVLALLAIGASLSAPQLATFFRGRTLDNEARRLLSLTHLGAARAAAEGRPMSLWFDLPSGRYGLAALETPRHADTRAQDFTLDPELRFELSLTQSSPLYADPGFLGGDRTAKPEIRFEPDGTLGGGSLHRVTLRLGAAATVSLTLTDDGLRYELLRHDVVPGR